MIQVGKQLWGLRGLTAVYLLYALIWIPLEGNLRRAVAMGVVTTAVLLMHGWQRYGAERVLSWGWWLGKTAVFGLLFGAGSSLLTLAAMAVKTGLHAHGPEFTPAEIIWVWQQLPLWAMAGLLAGLGAGLVIGNW